jgi:para-aminobenzoate synthetase component I
MIKEKYMDELKERMNHFGASRVPFFFMLDFNLQNGVVSTINEINPDEILFSVNGNTNSIVPSDISFPEQTKFGKSPVSFEEYNRQFNIIQKHILHGDSYLVNLTCATPVKTNLSLLQIFYKSQANYKLWYRDQMVVFSPEIFVQIKDNYIYSFPMKGTIDANITKAVEVILNDEKEAAEHATIVDLIRNDLSMVAEDVKVDEYRFIDAVVTHEGKLLQVSSKISGKLADGFHSRLGDIIFTLLPAGSISGAPKPRTIEIIHEAEAYQRGFYTGIFGHFDGQNLDSAVMIRFIEKTPEGLVFKSGGGITCMSDSRDEYDEMIRKVYLPF